MLRIGVVGVGSMGTVHISAWAKSPAQLVGLYALDKVRADLLGEQYGVKVYDDFESLLADVDVIDICTPTHLHYEMVTRAAAAGKHVICEKPLALTVADGQAMIDACDSAGVKLLIGHVVRFFPDYALAKATVERGDIGRVAVIKLSRCTSQPRKDADNWFLDPAISGGAMLDLMIHDYDYARWVGGEVESVFAKSVRSKTQDAAGDYAHVILRHSSGALSHVEGGWAYPMPMFRTALEIAGDKGLIEHPAGSSDPIEAFLEQSDEHTSEVQIASSPLQESPYFTEIFHFHDVLTGKIATPRVTAQDALAALRIGLAAIESAATGRAVNPQEVA
jgi:predicted dehydrogenase